MAKKAPVKKAPVKKAAKKATKLATNPKPRDPKVREADATAAAVHDAVATSADRAESPIQSPAQVSQ